MIFNKEIMFTGNILKIILFFLLFLNFSPEAVSGNKLNNMRLSYDTQSSKLRIVFDASKKINYKFNEKIKINELSIKFKDINISDKFIKPNLYKKYIKVLKLVRSGNNLKFNFKSNSPFKYKYFTLNKNDIYGHRLVLDVYFLKKISKNLNNKQIKPLKKHTVIAIDAGHGGKDPGAIGKKGTKEKHIVLSIAKRLYKLLKKEKNIKPILIRNKDTYMRLRHRIEKARKYKADLFISIHADAAKNRKAKGSSVYVLSQHGASSEAAKWLADKENAFDLVGGATIDDKDKVLAKVILDMSQTATIETSVKASRIIINKLKKISKLHSNNVEQAGFVVLKSPDIPSILIETAFLSNPKEEKKLKSKKFQKKIAKSIRDAILEIIKRGII